MSNFNDAWDDMLFNPERYDDDAGGYAPTPPRCRYCSTTSVKWGKTAEKKWRLMNTDGTPHTCEQYRSQKK